MHKPAFIERNRGITQIQQDAMAEIRKNNSEKIFNILGKSTISISEWHTLFDLLNEETAHMNSVAEFCENGNFILLTSYIKISDAQMRDIFLQEVMQKAPDQPLMAFCLLNELKAFQIKGIWTVPQIKDMLDMLDKKNIEYRKYLK